MVELKIQSCAAIKRIGREEVLRVFIRSLSVRNLEARCPLLGTIPDIVAQILDLNGIDVNGPESVNRLIPDSQYFYWRDDT